MPVHKVITVDQLVAYLRDRAYRVDAILEYDENKGREYGVCLSVSHAREERFYTHLHFHYKPNPHGSFPEISAHFKKGRHKFDQQGYELPVADAYALYIACNLLNLDKSNWKNFKPRVTDAMVQQFIAERSVQKLRSLFVSKVYDLAFWDMEAWSRFLDWNAAAA
jgi:hypothetical protein